jgi:vacuolar-type H+-ATPase subunit I/STV1
LDEDQQAPDVQEMEEGTPQPEPEQTTAEEIEVKEGVELTEEQQEDQEVLDLEAAIEGEVKEGRALPSETTAVEEVTGAVPEDVAVEEEVATEEKIVLDPSVKGSYKFVYDSKEDVPTELKDVKPVFEQEVSTGRGKNKKTQIKLGYTGEQLINAGIASGYSSDATQTITSVPTKTKVDGVVMSDKKRSKKEQALVDRAKRAAKALTKIGKGGVTIEVHDDTDSFKKVTGQDGRGAYDKTSNTIHINLSKANNTTVAHEAFHSVLLQRVSNTAKVTKTMFDAVRKAGKGDTRVMEYTTTKEVDGKTETVTETATVEEYREAR